MGPAEEEDQAVPKAENPRGSEYWVTLIYTCRQSAREFRTDGCPFEVDIIDGLVTVADRFGKTQDLKRHGRVLQTRNLQRAPSGRESEKRKRKKKGRKKKNLLGRPRTS